MMNKIEKNKSYWWEFFFQVILFSIVFIFYSIDRRDYKIENFEIAFFLNYAIAAFIINYFLLGKFLYKKKYWQFIFSVCILISLVILVEEEIIEKIYFPTTRGAHFGGIVFSVIGALPVITILAGFKFAWDALTKQKQLEELESAIKESELQYLKSQINPHFLFNNLNNLYAYALEDSKKTPEIILELSGVLRYMLYECKEEYVSLSKEIDHLEKFINLSKLQFEDRGEVTFTIQDNIPTNFKIAPLILSVFVENAFKHSSSSQSENIKIHVNIGISNQGQLEFKCANSFSMQSNTSDLSKGIGLENVRKRLELLYPNKYTLDLSTQNDIYEVKLVLELKEMKS